MYSFFLSHNRAEKEWSKELASSLADSGFSVFLDEFCISPGDDIVRSIGDALESSECLVFIMSTNSIRSRWVELEWASVLYEDLSGSTKRIVPILYQDCEIPFILRRLKYLDARNLSPTECALALVQGSNDEISEVRPEPTKSRLDLHRPVPFGSPHYLLREADAAADLNLRQMRPAFVFGPRMSGKTSLLLRIASEGSLLGFETVYSDLSATRGFSDVLLRLIRQISPREGVRLSEEEDVGGVFQDVAKRRKGKLILLLDEMDALRRIEESSKLLNLFRMLVDLGYLTVFGAGLLPPWELPEDPTVSPLSAAFEPIPIGSFSLVEVERLCRHLEVSAESAPRHLFRLTGGHAGLTIAAASALGNGSGLHEVGGTGFDRCYSISLSVANSIRYFVDETTLAKLLHGLPIRSRRTRERLWVIGAIDDPKANPLRIAGSMIEDRLREFQDEQTSDV